MSVSESAQAVLEGPHGTLRFPTTPSVSLSGAANYSEYDVTHTNYSFPAYQKSTIDDIGVDAQFYSDTSFLAKTTLDAIEFVRTAVKMDFNGSGAPPPILKFSYLGKNMFHRVPCVMVNYSIQYNNDVDYVRVNNDWLPIELQLNITLKPVYSPQKQARDFNFKQFANSSLVQRGYL